MAHGTRPLGRVPFPFLQSPSIRFDSGRNLFLLENWSGASSALARGSEVFTVSVDSPNVPALLGKYRIDNGALAFAPQFSLQPGLSYRAVARIPGGAPLTKVFTIPKPDMKPTTVVQRVYPSANVLPENQLKFYIHFSSAMARGAGYTHISLLDESGKKIDVPFLELTEELWDRSGKRFTVFFDPGRIKRGLLSHQELGIALQEGKRYTLLIDKGMERRRRPSDGRRLSQDIQRWPAGPENGRLENLDRQQTRCRHAERSDRVLP